MLNQSKLKKVIGPVLFSLIILFVLSYLNFNRVSNSWDFNEFIIRLLNFRSILYLVGIPIIVLLYNINKQYKDSKNKILIRLRNLGYYDYFLLLLTLFSINFFYDLIFNFYNALGDNDILIFLVIMQVIGLIGGTLVYLIGGLVQFTKIRFGNKRSVNRGINPNFKEASKFFIIRFNIMGLFYESKLPRIVKILNIIIYVIFVLLFLSTFFSQFSEVVSGNVSNTYSHIFIVTSGRTSRVSNDNIIEIKDSRGILQFEVTTKEYNKCDWGKTTSVIIKTHRFTHNTPSLNKIIECKDENNSQSCSAKNY